MTSHPSLRRLLDPRPLLAAGVGVALLTVVVASAERLNPHLLGALARLTPPWALLVVGAAIAVAALPPARRRVARARAALTALPAGAALALVVSASTALQVVRGASTTLPTILGDELIYSGLAKSVALDGALRFRGALHLGHSILHPVVLGPFFAAAGDAVGALLAVKVFQALLMALAAVPAYLVARRVSSHGWSLTVAALTALAPWTGYATLLTTEALFYPVFVAFAYAATTMLERPTARRQALALSLAAVAALVKPQAFVLLPALATAIAVFVATSRPRPPLRRYALVLGGLGAMTAAAAVVLAGSRNAPGGAYGALFDEAPGPVDLVEWSIWNAAAFGLGLGVVVLMAFPLAVGSLLGRGSTTAERSLAATAAALSAWVLVSVTILSAGTYGLGILHERSLFFLAPPVLACVARWLERGAPRRAAAAGLCAAAGVAAIAALPERFVERSNGFDYPALKPFTALLEAHPGVPPRVWLVGAAVAGAVVLLAARSAVAPVASVVVAFVALAGAVSWQDPVTTAEARRLAWVDRALPPSARATLLHVDLPPEVAEPCSPRPWYEQQALVVWTEFFNTRVDRVVHVYGPIRADGVPSPELVVARQGGVLLTDDRRTLGPDYVVVDSRQQVAGTRVRRFDLASAVPRYRDGASLTLWRAEKPLRLGPRPSPLPPRADGRACP